MKDITKKKPFAIDREQRKQRRRTHQRSVCSYGESKEGSGELDFPAETGVTTEQAEIRQIAVEMTQAFVGTVEFYKSEWGGSKPHDEAVKQALQHNEWRREYIEKLEPEKVSWGHITAVAQADVEDGFALWARVREAAADELEAGRRAAKLLGIHREPFELAQFLAIRDAFADQWQPNGGIESAMVDMLAVAYSLQMYWSTIAHQRILKVHNDQQKEVDRYENNGWKSPYQYEANALEQAHRLADSYNRQFLRVLRQLRDLRRYSPVVIQNNGGQVNVGTQQVNVQEAK